LTLPEFSGIYRPALPPGGPAAAEAAQKKGLPTAPVGSLVIPLKLLEAAIGVEPMNNGFADHCLGHLATPPRCLKEIFIPWQDFLTREILNGA
jgi:hypothetical protein